MGQVLVPGEQVGGQGFSRPQAGLRLSRPSVTTVRISVDVVCERAQGATAGDPASRVELRDGFSSSELLPEHAGCHFQPSQILRLSPTLPEAQTAHMCT